MDRLRSRYKQAGQQIVRYADVRRGLPGREFRAMLLNPCAVRADMLPLGHFREAFFPLAVFAKHRCLAGWNCWPLFGSCPSTSCSVPRVRRGACVLARRRDGELLRGGDACGEGRLVGPRGRGLSQGGGSQGDIPSRKAGEQQSRNFPTKRFLSKRSCRQAFAV